MNDNNIKNHKSAKEISNAKPKGDKAQIEQAGKGPVGEEHKPDPVRYGDWEHKGRCIDF